MLLRVWKVYRLRFPSFQLELLEIGPHYGEKEWLKNSHDLEW